MERDMKNRWIALYVENQVGVLAKVSGLFSGKSYNLQSLTVGTTEDETISRMTICVTSDDITFEQIKKQLNRMIEVIKVIDFTDVFVRMKEILYIKVFNCSKEDKVELFQIADTGGAASFLPRAVQGGQKKRCENCYDCNYYQEFYQCKFFAPFSHHTTFLSPLCLIILK